MAQKDQPDEGPSLELPSLFRRKKKTPQVDSEQPPTVDTDVAEPAGGTTQTEVLDEPDEEWSEPPAESVDAPDDLAAEPVEPAPEPLVEEPPVDLAPPPVEVDPVESAPAEAEPEPVAIVPVEEETVAAPPFESPVVDDPPAEDTVVEVPVVEAPLADDDLEPEAEPVAPVPAAPKPPVRDRIEAGLPDLAAGTAAVVVGAVVGLLGCVATFLSLKGCELATGTSSCGGPGLLVLIVILIGMILVGAVLLKLFRVAEPGNLSFLGVAITSVLMLVFLIKYLFSPWMFLVVPVLSALSFALARWVTTRWTDDGDGDPKTDYSHDVR